MKRTQIAQTLALGAVLASTLWYTASVVADVRVDGNTISWNDKGWVQVQSAQDYSSICEGGTYCEVSPGNYIVINHDSGKRYTGIIVIDGGEGPNMGDGGVTDDIIPSPPPPSVVVQTGQNHSALASDDGYLQAGEVLIGGRFGDNFNGTFYDNLTGLIWLSVRDCITDQTWAQAVQHAAELSAANGTCTGLRDLSKPGDWRLPNIKELQSLMNYANTFPVWDNGIPFTGDWDSYPWGDYWSSTSFVNDLHSLGWYLSAEFGRQDFQQKSNLARGWAVREGKVNYKIY